MRINKVLNNNVAVILGYGGQEIVVMGRGIAFQKKPGDKIDPSAVNKEFTLKNPEANYRFQELVASIPPRHILTSEAIIQKAKSMLDKRLNDFIYVTLTDHISSAMERMKEGIILKNPLCWDIQQYYPDEFRVGVMALKVIREQLSVVFLEDEAAFIALHFVNAEINGDMTLVHDITKLVQEVTSIVKYNFHIGNNQQPLTYFRFISHLKFFTQRMFLKQGYDGDAGEMLELLKRNHPDAYECTEKIATYILRRYCYTMSDEEVMCMTMHIARIAKEVKEKCSLENR